MSFDSVTPPVIKSCTPAMIHAQGERGQEKGAVRAPFTKDGKVTEEGKTHPFRVCVFGFQVEEKLFGIPNEERRKV